VGTLHREPVSVSSLRDDVRGAPGCIWSSHRHPANKESLVSDQPVVLAVATYP
jgi:hypothetical protein